MAKDLRWTHHEFFLMAGVRVWSFSAPNQTMWAWSLSCLLRAAATFACCWSLEAAMHDVGSAKTTQLRYRAILFQ